MMDSVIFSEYTDLELSLLTSSRIWHHVYLNIMPIQHTCMPYTFGHLHISRQSHAPLYLLAYITYTSLIIAITLQIGTVHSVLKWVYSHHAYTLSHHLTLRSNKSHTTDALYRTTHHHSQ